MFSFIFLFFFSSFFFFLLINFLFNFMCGVFLCNNVCSFLPHMKQFMKQFDSNVNYRNKFEVGIPVVYKEIEKFVIEDTSSDEDTGTASECTDYSDTDIADEY